MLGAVGDLKGVVKSKSKVTTSNVVFKVHTKLTTGLFFLCSILVTTNQLLGDPINCTGTADGENPKENSKVINNYCWIHSTFSVKTGGGQVGYDIPYHGVGPFNSNDKDRQVYRAYYQWVPLCLFFQGLLYILPHLIWKRWEGGKIQNLTVGVEKSNYFGDTEKIRLKIIDYLRGSYHRNKSYAFRYFLCEILNLINDIGNLYLINTFLGGEFLEYGTDVIEYSERLEEDRRDPMILLFPRLTKCTFRKFGGSGTLQVIDAFCVLNLNIMNEKIYIFFWFWLILLTIAAGLAVLYRLVLFCIPQLREATLRRSKGDLAVTVNWKSMVSKCDIGDYFVLKNLSDNMNEQTYGELITEFAAHLECTYPSTILPDFTDPKNEHKPLERKRTYPSAPLPDV